MIQHLLWQLISSIDLFPLQCCLIKIKIDSRNQYRKDRFHLEAPSITHESVPASSKLIFAFVSKLPSLPAPAPLHCRRFILVDRKSLTCFYFASSQWHAPTPPANASDLNPSLNIYKQKRELFGLFFPGRWSIIVLLWALDKLMGFVRFARYSMAGSARRKTKHQTLYPPSSQENTKQKGNPPTIGRNASLINQSDGTWRAAAFCSQSHWFCIHPSQREHHRPLVLSSWSPQWNAARHAASRRADVVEWNASWWRGLLLRLIVRPNVFMAQRLLRFFPVWYCTICVLSGMTHQLEHGLLLRRSTYCSNLLDRGTR